MILSKFLIFVKKVFKLTISEEKSLKPLFSFRTNFFKTFIISISLFCIASVFYFCVFSYTFCKKLIPGVKDSMLLENNLLKINSKVDLLYNDIQAKNYQLMMLKKILLGEVVSDSILQGKVFITTPYENIKIIEDSLLRQKVELEETINYLSETNPDVIKNLLFFKPLEGPLSNKFNVNSGHFGIDILGEKNEFFKNIFDGVVIFVDWGELNGGTIIISHKFNLFSVYKHASKINCSVNEIVATGDVLGVIGNRGELSNGPHLHFEMWLNSEPINPEDILLY